MRKQGGAGGANNTNNKPFEQQRRIVSNFKKCYGMMADSIGNKRNKDIALAYIKTLVNKKPSDITEKIILLLHELLLKNINDAYAGCYRSIPIRIAGSRTVLPNPLKVPDLMTEFISWLTTEKTLHPIALAGQAHYRFVTIHPFVDGNGRTARLLMNLILMMCGYPPAIIRNEDRKEYIESLETAQLGGSRDAFDKLIYDAVNRSLDIYLRVLVN